jgi:hypothetical protein
MYICKQTNKLYSIENKNNYNNNDVNINGLHVVQLDVHSCLSTGEGKKIETRD